MAFGPPRGGRGGGRGAPRGGGARGGSRGGFGGFGGDRGMLLTLHAHRLGAIELT